MASPFAGQPQQGAQVAAAAFGCGSGIQPEQYDSAAATEEGGSPSRHKRGSEGGLDTGTSPRKRSSMDQGAAAGQKRLPINGFHYMASPFMAAATAAPEGHGTHGFSTVAEELAKPVDGHSPMPARATTTGAACELHTQATRPTPAISAPAPQQDGPLQQQSPAGSDKPDMLVPLLSTGTAVVPAAAASHQLPIVPALQPVASSSGLASGGGSEWELDMRHITVIRRIAVGGFAEVFLGRYQGTLVAIKRLFADAPELISRFAHEVRVLARLRHPNLILFIGYTLRPEPCIISEYMSRGSLFSILRQRAALAADAAQTSVGTQSGTRTHTTQQLLEPKLQKSIAMAVARGMAYLHTRTPPIVHLDLKSPNILVDHAWRIKIADFGLATTRQHTWVSSGKAGGTPEWMAPEVLRCEKCDEKADVYSYGVILWELLTGQVPWQEFNPMQVVGQVGFAGRCLVVPEAGDPTLRQLCHQCMSSKAEHRPNFPDIVQLLDKTYGAAAAAVGPAAGEDMPGAPHPLPGRVAPPALPAAATATLATAAPGLLAQQTCLGNPCHVQAGGTGNGTAEGAAPQLQLGQSAQPQQPVIQEPPSADQIAQWHTNTVYDAAVLMATPTERYPHTSAHHPTINNPHMVAAALDGSSPRHASGYAPMDCSQPPSPAVRPEPGKDSTAKDDRQVPEALQYLMSPFAQPQQHAERTPGSSAALLPNETIQQQATAAEESARPSLNGSINGRSTGVGMRRKARSPVSSPDERMLAGSSRIVAQKLYHFPDAHADGHGGLPTSPRKLASRQYAAQQQLRSVGSAREHQPLGRASAPARTSAAHHSPSHMLAGGAGSPVAVNGHHHHSPGHVPTGGLLGAFDEAGAAVALPAFRLQMSARPHRRSTSFTGLTRQLHLHAAAKATPAVAYSAGAEHHTGVLHATVESCKYQGSGQARASTMARSGAAADATLQQQPPHVLVPKPDVGAVSPSSQEDVEMWDSASPAAVTTSPGPSMRPLQLHGQPCKDASCSIADAITPAPGTANGKTAMAHWLQQRGNLPPAPAASPRHGRLAGAQRCVSALSQEAAGVQEGEEEEAVSADAICSPGLRVVGLRPPKPGMGPCRRAYSARYNMTLDGTSSQHMLQPHHPHGKLLRVPRGQHRRTASDDGFITGSIAPERQSGLHTNLTTVRSGVVDADTAMMIHSSDTPGHVYPHSMDAVFGHGGHPLDIPRNLWAPCLQHPGLHEGSVCTDITFRSLIGSCASSSGGGPTPGASAILTDFSFLQHASNSGLHLQHAFSAGLLPPGASQAGAPPSMSTSSVWGERMSMGSASKRSMDGGSLRTSMDTAGQQVPSTAALGPVPPLAPIVTRRAALHTIQGLTGPAILAPQSATGTAGATHADPCTPPHGKITSHPLSDLSPVSPFSSVTAQMQCEKEAARSAAGSPAERRARRQLQLPQEGQTTTKEAHIAQQQISPFGTVSQPLSQQQRAQVELVGMGAMRVGFALPETCSSPVLTGEAKAEQDQAQVSACSPDVADLCVNSHVLSKANASRTWKSGRFKVTDFELPCSSPPASPSPAASTDHAMMHIIPPVRSMSPTCGSTAGAAMQAGAGHVAAVPAGLPCGPRAGSEPAAGGSTLQRAASASPSYLVGLPGQQRGPLPGGGLRAALTVATTAAAGTGTTEITPWSSVSKDDVDEGEDEGQQQQASSYQQSQLRRTSTMMYRKGRFFVSSTQLHVDAEDGEEASGQHPVCGRESSAGTGSATPSAHSSLHASRCPTPSGELPVHQHSLPHANLFSSLQQPIHAQQHLGLTQVELGVPSQSAVTTNHQANALHQPAWWSGQRGRSIQEAGACHIGNSSSMPQPHARPTGGQQDMSRCLSAPGPPQPRVSTSQPPPVLLQRAYQKGRFDVVERVSGSIDNLVTEHEGASVQHVTASCADSPFTSAVCSANPEHMPGAALHSIPGAATVSHEPPRLCQLQQETFSGSMDVWLPGPHDLPCQAHHPSPLMTTHSVQMHHLQQHVAEPANSFSSGGAGAGGATVLQAAGSVGGTPGAKRVGRFTIISDGPASPPASPPAILSRLQQPATAADPAAAGHALEMASYQEGGIVGVHMQSQQPLAAPAPAATRIIGFDLPSPPRPPKQKERSPSPIAPADVPVGERRAVRAVSKGRFLVIEESPPMQQQQHLPPMPGISTVPTCNSPGVIGVSLPSVCHVHRQGGHIGGSPMLAAAVDVVSPVQQQCAALEQQQLCSDNTQALHRTGEEPVAGCDADSTLDAMDQDTVGAAAAYEITVESNLGVAQQVVVDLVLDAPSTEEGEGQEEGEEDEGGAEQVITVQLWQHASLEQ